LAEVPDSIDVYITEKDAVETVKFEEYVKGVVASEMPSEFNIEALKAQSVAARTYSLAKQQKAQSSGNPKSHSSAPLCDTTHCQVYRDAATLKSLKGDKWMETSWPKICEAVDATKGQLLYYNGELVQQALFHSSSGGKTENCEDVFASAVPYLVSVDSPYEDAATHQNEETTFTLSQFSSKIKAANPRIDFGSITSSNIKIVSRSSGGRVENMSIGKGVLTGRSVREALGLSSANFTISITKDNITFTSNGSGHGVGMSQYGANGMAEEGYDYKEILAHYYTGTEVY
jgi:stage II sporulation protein D